MIATSHVIIGGAVGVAVGTVTKNPAIALAAGMTTHFLCDALPHLDAPFKLEYKDGQYDQLIWNKKLWSFAVCDSLVAFLLTLFLWNKYFHLSITAPFAWAALGAYLPDLIDNFPLWRNTVRKFPILKQFHKLHLAAHNLWRFKFTMPEYWFLGALTQIGIALPCLWYIVKY